MKPYRELWWPRFWPFLRIKDELPATKRGKRKASNYGVSIVIRRDVLENESWVLQQEIYESRYWLRHPWRLAWAFGTFYGHPFFAGVLNAFSGFPIDYARVKRQAAAHLARVEAASRAQEIRAYLHESYAEIGMPIPPAQPLAWAHGYARSIHGASNYPFLKAAGWDEERVYQEIVRHL